MESEVKSIVQNTIGSHQVGGPVPGLIGFQSEKPIEREVLPRDPFNARCVICDHTEWQHVDEHIHKDQGAHICKNCGFVTYDSILKSDDMKEFYRNDYRGAPSIMNEYTVERKIHYHNIFLNEVFLKWKENKTKPVIFESGAAYGRVLHFIKNNFPEADVEGSELTLAMRRVAAHDFGIKLLEDFNDKKKYDLILSYKVAEHIPDIDKELRKYAECLSEGGYLYIGVPIWFKEMNNFGIANWSIDGYYHPNHINMWTRKLFQTLLKKSGLKIIKENFTFYDDVYLCKRDDSLMTEKPEYEDYLQIIESMKKIKLASDLYNEGKFKEALEQWPNFPTGQWMLYQKDRAKLHKEGWPAIQKFMDNMISACPESANAMSYAAKICAMYEKFKEATKLLEMALQMKPNTPSFLMELYHALYQMGDLGQAREVAVYLGKVSQEARGEAMTWQFHCSAQMPCKYEDKKKLKSV